MPTTSISKTRRGDKRERILKAAEKVFASKGFYPARITDIAKEAGVAEGTIYIYFDSKEDLILSIFKDKFDEWMKVLKERLAACSSALEKLRTIIGTHFTTLYENPHLAQLIQIELRACSAFMRGGSAPEMRKYLRIIEEVLKEGKERGEFRSDFNEWLAARALLGIMDEMATVWVLKKRLSLPAIVDDVLEIFYKGIKGGV
ncbi:TetR/AcrR family transcriptional regulator, fatty acid metabolism regulator protein [Thermosulfidibacter takaii ABI70S6]|uniref:TetR/AcrR family transcriptional regulator, fatty acid metabolism regulator protein n=1 Tax=Thermosulfidibacter takaii (strain DSM 17441 / JCM 13301 / NBRC 103674 / ABI70S6) TaxID=1298851 RepID=A0A0S3QRN3_THET7|nr:TetR/AcrR family transcriptional regulator [Thermosulfidibacter takaii]BAT70979.1 TetR/AcrR family transcriptional regulator, fatty acid metabolism regulator protein [Thermosulfidibacter takaii ABI70S6]